METEEIQMKKIVLRKLDKELKDYRLYLLSVIISAEQLLNHAYEFVWKEEIYSAISSMDEKRFLKGKWNFLYNKDNTLEYLYQLWMKCDCRFTDELADIILDEVNYDMEVQSHE
ncbi:MAG: hypothetical protein K0S18_288 [Anaerocolumna sp.]|jgi:radical SAM superfamily enzyme YgiQ (UPF0313 family)|nr:hypothetical protein [Anaerocolumna sp.]